MTVVDVESAFGAGRLHDRMPPRPDPDLDPVLDAVEQCLTRFGIRRTSMTDIARELRVARTTLYRQVGSLEEAISLVASRRFHRFLDELVSLSAGGIDVETFVQVVVRTVRTALDDPVLQRVLRDEPQVLGDYLASGSLQTLAAQVIEMLTPVLTAASAAGIVRTTDPAMTAAWLVRIVLSLGAVPPPDDELDATVRHVLLPLFGA
jgi:AcrR family transcriptional regulator